jgi:hypothetical protein
MLFSASSFYSLLPTPTSYSIFPTPYFPFIERKRYGISAASGLPKLWIAGWNYGGLDNGRYGFDQQLLQAAGPERDPVHGTLAVDRRIANGAVELSAPGAAGRRDDAAGER